MPRYPSALVPQTFSGRGRCEQQWVSQHVVVIPHIQLVVSGVVVNGGDVLVRVGEGYLNRQLLSTAGVVGINHHVAADSALRLPLVILENRTHCVEHTTGHEGVARPSLVKASGPRALKAEGVGIHLQDNKDMDK